MDTTQGSESGAEAGMMSLAAGILVPFFFNALVQGADNIVLLLVLGVFGTLIVYGEIFVSLPTGVAFGAGMLLTSFAAQNWWLVGLATAAWMVKLAKCAWLDSVDEELEGRGISLSPAISDWFKRLTTE